MQNENWILHWYSDLTKLPETVEGSRMACLAMVRELEGRPYCLRKPNGDIEEAWDWNFDIPPFN